MMWATSWTALVRAVLLWASWLQARAQIPPQNERAVLDFAFVNDPRQEITADVIHGVLKIEAPIHDHDFKRLEESIGITLASICPTDVKVLVRIYQEVKTFRQVWTRLHVAYWLLPENRDSQACAIGLHQPENFKKLLAWRLMFGTGAGGVAEWRIEMEPAMVQRKQVHWPSRLQPPPRLSSTPPGPLKEGFAGASSGGGPPPGVEPPVNTIMCSYATSPCMCATTESCAWRVNGSGYRCLGSNEPTDIPCTFCGLQSGCPMSQVQECRLHLDPCECTLSSSRCRWDMSAFACLPQNGANTSCSICSHQAHCDTPKVVDVDPVNRSFARRISVVFDRPIVFQGMAEGVLFRCEPQRPKSVVQSFLELQGQDLSIDVAGLELEAESTCELLLVEGLVRDEDGVVFVGMKERYFFRLPDTIGPRITKLLPENGAKDVAPGSSATLVFNEPVLKVPACEVTLSAEDADVTSYGLFSSDVTLSQDRRRLTVDLGEHLKKGKVYSLRLPQGCVTDDSNNTFNGLAGGVYIFHTEEATVTGSEDSEDVTVLVIIIVASVLGAMVLVICVYLCCRYGYAKQAFIGDMKQTRSWRSIPRQFSRSSSTIERDTSGKSISSSSWNAIRAYARFLRKDERNFSLDRYAISGNDSSRDVTRGSSPKAARPVVREIVASPPREIVASPPTAVAAKPPSSQAVLLPAQSGALAAQSARQSQGGAHHLSVLQPQAMQGPRAAGEAGTPDFQLPGSPITERRVSFSLR